MGIGDCGLEIENWTQSPIPNPQYTIPNPPVNKLQSIKNFNIKNIFKKFNINIKKNYQPILLIHRNVI